MAEENVKYATNSLISNHGLISLFSLISWYYIGIVMTCVWKKTYTIL